MLEIKKDLQQIAEAYQSRPRHGLSSMLIYGVSGGGKTALLPTAPAPVLVYQFDPDGCETIIDYVTGQHGKDRRVYPIDLSMDDPTNPTSFRDFARDLKERKRTDFFNNIGTVALDSVTTFGHNVMSWVQKQNGNVGKAPEIQEWGLQVIKIRDTILELLSLPCHVIVTGHEGVDQDDLLKVLIGSVAVTKSLKITLPALFSEVYRLKVEQKSKGMERKLVTVPDGKWVGKTRMGHGGSLGEEVDLNIREILKKVGKQWEDKIV